METIDIALVGVATSAYVSSGGLSGVPGYGLSGQEGNKFYSSDFSSNLVGHQTYTYNGAGPFFGFITKLST